MRIARATLGIIIAASSGAPAMADDICAQLRTLLADPPSGFVALRGERTSQVWPRWTGKPFLPGATCEIIGSDEGPNSELRCVVNEKSAPGVADAFYDATRKAIDACLASLPHGRDYARQESAKGADGFEGKTTSWAYRSRAERIDIDLTNDRKFGNARNSFSVKYQKQA